MRIIHIYSINHSYWNIKRLKKSENAADNKSLYIEINTEEKYQKLDEYPWGGCFADRGWMAMEKLSDSQREEILNSLFGTEGLCFTAARLPMGNSDFSDTHKSYNEYSGDYDMNKFSIESDKKYLLPYINAALKINPNIRFFSTPWSPPSWMKYNSNIHGIDEDNRIIFKSNILKAYARYFVKYILEYQKKGINIYAITPQNEPTMNTEYASCIWSGEELNEFIRDYLYPEFDSNKIKTNIWLGTFTDSNASLAIPALEDEKTVKIIDTVCFQWWGAYLASAVKKAYNKNIIQSESKCGDGKNNWEYAEEQFDCFKEFLEAGANAYYLWNMVLDEKGENTSEHPWCQNAPITVHSRTLKIIYNPSYYLTKHFTYCIKPMAERIRLNGTYKDTIGFINPDGEIIIEIKNPLDKSQNVTIKYGEMHYNIELLPHSINTLRICNEDNL